MTNPRKNSLTRQIERIPMDPVLRNEVLAGVDGLSDFDAREKAGKLKMALDSLPDLAQRLRTATREGRQNSQRTPLAPLKKEA